METVERVTETVSQAVPDQAVTIRWQAGSVEFEFPRPALVMGILNVTPDSFSDGGRYIDPQQAVDQAHRMVADGAEIIDVGGESTRPGASAVPESEEVRRVVPVVKRLVSEVKVPVSVDTMKPGVAAAAVEAGASIINDVAANRGDAALWQVVAASGVGYVCMHMQGEPRTMQSAPAYTDVVAEVEQFFEDRLGCLCEVGVQAEQVVLDVGIGFGKTLAHNLQLLRALQGFTRIPRPMLLGVSRKSFIDHLLGANVEDRLPASLACACAGVLRGVSILRVHDVAATVQAVRMTEAIR